MQIFCVCNTKSQGSFNIKIEKKMKQTVLAYVFYNENVTDIPLLIIDPFINTVRTLSRSMMIRNTLSLLVN